MDGQTFQAIVLGIVQGLAEFLPISSSAHLVLAPYFFQWRDPGLAFDVALHMGTLVAILVFFWKDWLDILNQVFARKKSNHSVDWRWILAGTIPGAVIGKLFEQQAEESFRNPLLIAFTLVVFGILLGFADRKGKKKRDVTATGLKDALLVGCAQALAIVPGVSRAGITITMALFLGFTRSAAARFSFLLSAPIIAGAGILKSKHIFAQIAQGGDQAAMVYAGFLASLIAGLAALSLLTRLLKSRTFDVFVAYRVVLAFVIVAIVVSR